MAATVVPAGRLGNGVELFQAVCDDHPTFRRVPWSGRTVPQESADQHNAEHHQARS